MGTVFEELQIAPRTESLARAGEHSDAQMLVLREALHYRLKFFTHTLAQGIEFGRNIQGNRSDAHVVHV